MGDTFNAFVKFISDDPIMLGLCVAIIVLVVLFIIVLLVGKGKDASKEQASEIDKTTELLKTDINLDALKSTQEFSVANMDKSEDVVATEPTNAETPVVETTTIEEPKEVPVNTETIMEPSKIESENDNAHTVEPAVEATQDIEPSVVIPNIGNEVKDPTENIFDSNIEPIVTTTMESIAVPVETSVPEPLEIEAPLEPKDEENVVPSNETVPYIDPFNIQTPNITYREEENTSPIVESNVAPLDEKESLTSILNEINSQSPETKEEVTLDVQSQPNESEIVEFPKEQPFSSVYAPNEQMPNTINDDYSQAEILKNTPVTDGFNPVTDNIFDKVEEQKPVTVEEDYDDLELPKLISSESNDTVFKDIKGESFNIE